MLAVAVIALGRVNEASAVTAPGVVTIASGTPGASALVTGQPMSAPTQAAFKLKLRIVRVRVGTTGGPAEAEVALCTGPSAAFSTSNPTCGTGTTLSAVLRGGQEGLAIASGDGLSGKKLWVAARRVSPSTSPITVEFEVTVE
jgi:hypothetical protein